MLGMQDYSARDLGDDAVLMGNKGLILYGRFRGCALATLPEDEGDRVVKDGCRFITDPDARCEITD